MLVSLLKGIFDAIDTMLNGTMSISGFCTPFEYTFLKYDKNSILA